MGEGLVFRVICEMVKKVMCSAGCNMLPVQVEWRYRLQPGNWREWPCGSESIQNKIKLTLTTLWRQCNTEPRGKPLWVESERASVFSPATELSRRVRGILAQLAVPDVSKRASTSLFLSLAAAAPQRKIITVRVKRWSRGQTVSN